MCVNTLSNCIKQWNWLNGNGELSSARGTTCRQMGVCRAPRALVGPALHEGRPPSSASHRPAAAPRAAETGKEKRKRLLEVLALGVV